MLALRTVVRDYAWGRRDGMAAHVGSAPTGRPEAELWVGTHPAAPSVVEGDGRTLAEVVASDPRRHLGPDLAAAGHTALPFLLKVLAIGRPLSLQAHPSAGQAAAGFAREEAAGVPPDAPERTYRDANPKPEALVALTETWALCGFRPPAEAVALVEALGVGALAPLAARLAGPDGLRAALGWVLRLGGAERAALLDALAAAVPPAPDAPLEPAEPAGPANARAWIARIQDAFPGDAAALAPLFVAVTRLLPGEAVHLPAGNLHAYLDGAGVEIMAASDNVLRGGLTPKHIDVDELLAVLRFAPGLPPAPRRVPVAGGTAYDCGEDAFLLTALDADRHPKLHPDGPSLLLATGGEVVLDQGGDQDGERLVLDGGRAAFVAPGEAPIAASGPGRLWWATVGGHGR